MTTRPCLCCDMSIEDCRDSGYGQRCCPSCDHGDQSSYLGSAR